MVSVTNHTNRGSARPGSRAAHWRLLQRGGALLAGLALLWSGWLVEAQPPNGREPAQPEPANLVTNLAEAAFVAPPAPEKPIDLAAALQLAEAVNPTIGQSLQVIQEALANRLRARGLMLPTLRAGTNYHVHQGVLQNSFGKLRRVDEESLYFGGGARTLAAESVAFPMVQIVSPLTDAIFEPLAAQQLVAVRNAESTAVHNDILLQVATRYLELAGAEALLAATHLSEVEMNRIVQTAAGFLRAGQGREGDFKRARADALLLHVAEQRAEEEMAVAAAELSRLLHLDPSVRLRTPAGAVGVLELVDPCQELPQLIETALMARPELAALRAEVARKQVQIRQ
jgi:outer membrane protein TolC